MYKAINIKWETDGCEVDLPSEVNIPERFIDKDGVDEEAVSDWLSDMSGWLHDGFEIVDEIKEIITEYITDTITKVKSNIDGYNYEMLIEYDGNDNYKFYYLNGNKPCDPDFEYWVLCNM